MTDLEQHPNGKPPPGRKRQYWIIALALVIGLVIGGAVGYPLGRSLEARAQKEAAAATYKKRADKYKALTDKLVEANGACQPANEYAQVTDELNYMDGTLTLSAAQYSTNSTLECVEKQLNMPSSLVSQIGMTNAYNGMQNGQFNEYTVTWSYNGNSGLSFSITPTEPSPAAE